LLPIDITTFIARRFEPSARREALRLLRAATIHDGTKPTPRLLRCAVVASGGSIERLRMEVRTLARDYRDVIVEGEYVPANGELVKVRDLNQPIPDDT
jgi:hypothetical protein